MPNPPTLRGRDHPGHKNWLARMDAFTDQYLTHFNASRAAREVGVPPKRAKLTACEWRRTPEVKQMLAAKMKARTEDSAIKTHRLLEELAVMAYSNVADYKVDPDAGVSVVDAEATPDAMRAVKSIKRRRTRHGKGEDITETDEVEFVLHDKLGAVRTGLQVEKILVEQHREVDDEGKAVKRPVKFTLKIGERPAVAATAEAAVSDDGDEA